MSDPIWIIRICAQNAADMCTIRIDPVVIMFYLTTAPLLKLKMYALEVAFEVGLPSYPPA